MSCFAGSLEYLLSSFWQMQGLQMPENYYLRQMYLLLMPHILAAIKTLLPFPALSKKQTVCRCGILRTHMGRYLRVCRHHYSMIER